MLDDGEVGPLSELAKKAGLTRVRVTQIMKVIEEILDEATVDKALDFDTAVKRGPSLFSPKKKWWISIGL
ncbi:MAG: hypothetical protein HQ589_09695 [Syntrophaceae bacterium]|nr:hypothetical protein [Syntrophaceae bacterium]